jgi:hypothetical protein
MKSWFMVAAFAALASATAAAGDPWVSIQDGDREAVVVLAPDHPVTVLRHETTALFGESAAHVALISYNTAAAQYQLRIIDKKSRQTLAAWPVPDTPVRNLSGAVPDIVLVDDAAFVLTHSGSLGAGATPVRNERGGFYNLARIALRTGRTTVLPIGDVVANPRLASFDGIPVITAWGGYSVLKLSADGEGVDTVIDRAKLFSQLPEERAERERRTLPFNARADYVAIPGGGIFRMSKLGVLQRVANEQLGALQPPFASLALGPAQFHERLLAMESSRGPAIAVVRREQDARALAVIDAATLTENWRRDLPLAVSSWSLVAAGNDALLGIDAEKSAVVRITRGGIETVGALPPGAHHHARILSAGNP